MKADLTGVSALDRNLAQRNTVGDMLARAARVFPDRIAVRFEDRTQTYRELESASNQIGRQLLAIGAEHQEPVGFLLSNSDAFLETFFGCAKAGLVAMPVNLAQSAQDVAYVLADAGVRTIITDEAFVPLLREVLPQLPDICRIVIRGAVPDELGDDSIALYSYDQLCAGDDRPIDSVIIEDSDIVHCLYSSGTTSRPKGVLTRHSSLVIACLSSALVAAHQYGRGPSIFPIVLPLFHTTALDTLALPTLVVGGTVVLFNTFDPAALIAAIDRYQATHMMLLPSMYEMLMNHPDAAGKTFASVRLCFYAMAPMPDARRMRLQEVFPNADTLLGSGMTECVPPTCFQWPVHDLDKSGSWGVAVPSCDVQIADPEGNLLGPNETGEIVYRGPHVMHGYWNNAAANTEVFRGGWMRTGDIGHIDEEAVIWFTDRAKDIVKSGGENVSSVEVERILLAHPAVAEAAVIGRPDDRWGEAVTAVIVKGAEVTEEELITHSKKHLSGFKVPKYVEFVEVLPKTATGKIQKHHLRT